MIGRQSFYAPAVLLIALLVVAVGCASTAHNVVRGTDEEKVRGTDEEKDWQVVHAMPSLQAYSSFAHAWPTSGHIAEMDRTLIEAEITSAALELVDHDSSRVVRQSSTSFFVLKSGRARDLSRSIVLSDQKLALRQLPDGQVAAKGTMEYSLGGGGLSGSIWAANTRHTLYGRFVNLGTRGVVVYSDPTAPLEFRVGLNGDYVFSRSGRGAFFVPAGMPTERIDDSRYDRNRGTVFLFGL